MQQDDYYCVLSGIAPNLIGEDEGDELVDLPNGWIKITIQRRYENPKWVLVQQIKQASMEQMLAQVPESDRESVTEAISLQIEAQYCTLEDKLGRYIVDEEIRYIADPSQSEELFDETHKLFQTLEIDMEDFEIEKEESEEILENVNNKEDSAIDTTPVVSNETEELLKQKA